MSWMKRLFGGKEKTPRQVLHFNSGDDALEYACKFLDCAVETGALLPSVIQQVWPGNDGMDELGLYVATNAGPKAQRAYAPSSLGLARGDLVGLRIVAIRPPPADIFAMPEVLLAPTYDLEQGAWIHARILRPEVR